MRLSLDALQILDAIDRGGSFSAAARELHRVPSTISYAVGQLEEGLGVRVFERIGPRIRLTGPGRELLREGRHLLRAAQDLELRVRRVASGWETEVALGLDSLLDPGALVDDVAAFCATAPGTRLRIATGALTGTWEALLERRVDLLVGAAGEGPSGGGYTAEAMGALAFVFAVAPSHPLAAIDRRLGKADMQPHRAVIVSDSARNLLPRTVGLLSGQEVLAVPDMRQKLRFQLAGLGFGFLPEPLARPCLEAGTLVALEVEEPRAPEPLHLAWRTEAPGAGLDWWRRRLRVPGTLERLLLRG